jgi:hypothetical protein
MKSSGIHYLYIQKKTFYAINYHYQVDLFKADLCLSKCVTSISNIQANSSYVINFFNESQHKMPIVLFNNE